jgi:uncharacterized membrane protein HdeD (DUF308 family)
MSTSASPIADFVPKSLNWSIFLSVLLILAGIIALFLPMVSGLGITLFLGWLLIVSGVTHFIFAFKSHHTGHLIWELLLGAVYVFTGIYLILHPVAGLLTLTLFLAIYLFFEGILEVFQFFQIRPRHGAGWLLFDAAITLILAIMIWRAWPASSVWVIGTLVGLSMIFSGFSRLMLALAARRVYHSVTS